VAIDTLTLVSIVEFAGAVLLKRSRRRAGTVLQLVPSGYSVTCDDRVQPWGAGRGLHACAAALVTRTCR